MFCILLAKISFNGDFGFLFREEQGLYAHTGRLSTLYEIFWLSYLNEFWEQNTKHAHININKTWEMVVWNIIRIERKKEMPKERKRLWHKMNKPRKKLTFMSNNWQVIRLIFIVVRSKFHVFISFFLFFLVDVLIFCLSACTHSNFIMNVLKLV